MGKRYMGELWRHGWRIPCTLLSVLVAIALPVANSSAATCPNELLRQVSNLNSATSKPYSTELPDCRAYEQVTPVEKGQAAIDSEGPAGEQLFHQASSDGEGFVYDTEDSLPGSAGGPLLGLDVAFREKGAEGWSTTLLGVPQLLEAPSEEEMGTYRFLYFSPTLSCGLEHSWEPLGTLPTGETAGEVNNLYMWNAETDTDTIISDIDPSNRPASISSNHTGDGLYHVYGVSGKDCGRVVFASEYHFLAGAPASGLGLYEWDEGVLRLLSVLPDGTVTSVKKFGNLSNEEASLSGAVSDEGSRVFFTADSNSGADSGSQEIFMREAGTSTVEVTKSETPTPDNGAKFEAASGEGTEALFIANYGLTSSSSMGATSCGGAGEVATGDGCDLYLYNTEKKTLTDLSADTNMGDTEGADVQGILGISQNATYVYFSALGQLVLGKGETETENKANSLASVYVWHEGHISYVATITQEDDDTSNGADLLTVSAKLASRVSPEGSYLLFSATTNVTGYDNNAQAELYLYSAQSEKVVCVSCDPNGAVPRGSAKASLLGLNNGYAPRNLSENGEQVFFTSSDQLAPGADPGQNAYEWEREGVGSCTQKQAEEVIVRSGGCIYLLAGDGSVLDASANGESVFVTSPFRLVAQDLDGETDVYDVRVDGGLPAPTITECSGEECQGPLSQVLSFERPGSTGPSVDGRVQPQPEAKTPVKTILKPLTRAQQLANALKVCKKKPKRRRVVCEAQARKRYAAKAKSPIVKSKHKKSSRKRSK